MVNGGCRPRRPPCKPNLIPVKNSIKLCLSALSSYGFLNAGFAFSGIFSGTRGHFSVVCFISGLYCVAFSMAFAMFAWTTLEGSMRPLVAVAGGSYELRTWGRLLRSFGEHWWERIVPVQRRLTPLAWPGVTCDEQPRFI
jgi:hypothetical protein